MALITVKFEAKVAHFRNNIRHFVIVEKVNIYMLTEVRKAQEQQKEAKTCPLLILVGVMIFKLFEKKSNSSTWKTFDSFYVAKGCAFV